MHPDLSTVEGVVNAVQDASAHRQYQLLGALLIVIVVAVVRKLAALRGGKLAELVRSDLGGVALSLATSSAGAAYSALKGGAHLDLSLVLSALANAAFASGLFTYGKHVKAKVNNMRKPKAKKAPPKEDPTPTTTTKMEVPK